MKFHHCLRSLILVEEDVWPSTLFFAFLLTSEASVFTFVVVVLVFGASFPFLSAVFFAATVFFFDAAYFFVVFFFFACGRKYWLCRWFCMSFSIVLVLFTIYSFWRVINCIVFTSSSSPKSYLMFHTFPVIIFVPSFMHMASGNVAIKYNITNVHRHGITFKYIHVGWIEWVPYF